MIKYLVNYIILTLIFLLIDLLLYISPSTFSYFTIIPTITKVGEGTIFFIIPYSLFIVWLLFIRKANKKENTIEYLNIKNKIIISVTIINIISTLIETFIFENMFIWIGYTFFMLLFLIILNPKKDNKQQIIDDNIRDYRNNK